MSEPLPFFAAAREWAALRDELSPRVEAVLASGRVLQGPAVATFEGELAAWVGRRHAVAPGSGTEALAFALLAAGVGPGDEVLVPAFLFIARRPASCGWGPVRSSATSTRTARSISTQRRAASGRGRAR